MLVDVQVSVAADADVPSFGVARIAKDRAVLLIKALGALVHLDVGPLVLKTGGDDDGARQKPLDGERFSVLKLFNGGDELKELVPADQFEHHSAAILDPCKPAL